MIEPNERLLWEEIHRHLAAIDAAIVRYMLDQEEPQLPPRFVQHGPPNPLAAAIWFHLQGVKVD